MQNFKIIREKIVGVSLVACFAFSLRAEALPFKPKDIKITESQITSIEIEFKLKDKTLSRVIACYGKSPGISFKKKSVLYFRTLKDELKSISSDLKINARNKRKFDSLKIKQDQLKALIKASAESCNIASPPAAPPPVVTSAPSPTLAPTVPATNLNFDSSGNVTERGKIAFKIPPNFQANTIAGQQTSLKYSCTGCHVERGGYDYLRIKSGLSRDPMNSFGVTEQEIADLAAWLNRGKLQ